VGKSVANIINIVNTHNDTWRLLLFHFLEDKNSSAPSSTEQHSYINFFSYNLSHFYFCCTFSASGPASWNLYSLHFVIWQSHFMLIISV